ncbi:hypothetical protein PYCCODRAFT_335592 [Trametes coccinea BRFM310]|uniref:Uncharacterized protein n=1 Tax=Trametes coccinea (strain BRFM310) TaxID=1353009 RepID=A0A1Y2J2P5_TRAC3|nr:hypothetical protein PYCCODRAFT_335592 [Trametes coccinea BRFM310]
MTRRLLVLLPNMELSRDKGILANNHQFISQIEWSESAVSSYLRKRWALVRQNGLRLPAQASSSNIDSPAGYVDTVYPADSSHFNSDTDGGPTDFDVLVVLYALAMYQPTGINISKEELGLISERLGEQGESIAQARFAHCLTGPMPSSATIAGPLPHPPAHQSHLIPPTPLASSASAPTDVPAPGPTPASVLTAGPSRLAITQGAASPTVLGKRRADPPACESAALPVKRTRGPPPVPQGEVTCRWGGCTETVPRGRAQEHVRKTHFSTVSSLNAVKEPQQCQWLGCKVPTPRGKEGYAGLNGLFKHMRDVHFQVKHIGCPFEGCTHTGRDDSMSRHKEVCLHNPQRKQADKENQSEEGESP